MFNRRSACAVILVLCTMGAAAAARAAELSVYAETRAGPLQLIFRYESGKEDWVAPLAAEAPGYIPLAEDFLNRPFPGRGAVTFQGCHNCQTLLDLPNRTIYLNYDRVVPTTNPAVLFHEINHFWYYYPYGDTASEWLMEGISSFLPSAMRQAGQLPDLEKYHQLIDRWWGLDWRPGPDFKDAPLVPYTDKIRASGIIYTKSYRLQYLLHCLLGPRRYLRFIRTITDMRRHTMSTMLHALARQKKFRWRRLLRGWVTGRHYRTVALQDFWEDLDSDGLSNAKEFCAGTDRADYDTDADGLPDGGELAIGTDPLRADADAAARLAAHGPFIDGSAADWSQFDKVSESDPAGDASGPPWADMCGMSYRVQDGRLSVMVTAASPPAADADVFFDVLVDTDADGHTNEEFAFMLDNPIYTWHYNCAAKSSSTPAGLEAARGAVFEIAIPLSEIPAAAFRILPIIRSSSLKVNYDGWGRWIEISG